MFSLGLVLGDDDGAPAGIARRMSVIPMTEPRLDDSDLAEMYAELRRIAGFQMRRAAQHPTLHPTLLVHEAWVRLNGAKYRSKTHYLSLASRVMRNVVVDYIRRKTAERRGGSWQKVTLEMSDSAPADNSRMQFRLDQVLDV